MILLKHLFKVPFIITLFFIAFLCMFLIYRSWQYLTFDARPVVFVRIVGVDNTANEVCIIIVE